MNYMPEVLKMLGVEVGEEFNIEESAMGPYHFDDDYLLINSRGNLMEYANIVEIMRGVYTIEKLPWKPNKDDIYFFITESGYITSSQFFLRTFDYNSYNAGNCFRTAEEITPEIKQRILREMKGKYEND